VECCGKSPVCNSILKAFIPSKPIAEATEKVIKCCGFENRPFVSAHLHNFGYEGAEPVKSILLPMLAAIKKHIPIEYQNMTVYLLGPITGENYTQDFFDAHNISICYKEKCLPTIGTDYPFEVRALLDFEMTSRSAFQIGSFSFHRGPGSSFDAFIQQYAITPTIPMVYAERIPPLNNSAP
jgi:hypothetical protein